MKNLPEKKSVFRGLSFFNEDDDGIMKWIKSISLLSFLISLLIFTDYFLPFNEEKQKITELNVRTGFEDISYPTYVKKKIQTGEDEFWIITDKDEIAVTEEVLKTLHYDDTILVLKTSVFRLNVKMKISNPNDSEYFYPYLNVFGFFIFFPVAFILIFILNIIFKTRTELIISLGVINMILLVGFGVLILFY